MLALNGPTTIERRHYRPDEWQHYAQMSCAHLFAAPSMPTIPEIRAALTMLCFPNIDPRNCYNLYMDPQGGPYASTGSDPSYLVGMYTYVRGIDEMRAMLPALRILTRWCNIELRPYANSDETHPAHAIVIMLAEEI